MKLFMNYGGQTSDPYWSMVKLLLQFEGVEGSATFTDESTIGAVATQYGSPIITLAAGKFGRGFAGNGGAAGRSLLFPSNAAYAPGTGQFTLEWFGRNDNGSQDVGVLGLGESGSQLVFSTTSGDLRLRRTGYPNFGTITQVTNGFPADGAYHHYFVGRDASNVMYIGIDGIIRFSATVTDNIVAAPFAVGAWVPSSGTNRAAFQGGIDGVRLTIGACRYTSSYIPPSGPYPTS